MLLTDWSNLPDLTSAGPLPAWLFFWTHRLLEVGPTYRKSHFLRVRSLFVCRRGFPQNLNRFSFFLQTRTTRKPWRYWSKNNPLLIRSVYARNMRRKNRPLALTHTHFPTWLATRTLLNVHHLHSPWVGGRRKEGSVMTCNRYKIFLHPSAIQCTLNWHPVRVHLSYSATLKDL